jgi:hypothetical protein
MSKHRSPHTPVCPAPLPQSPQHLEPQVSAIPSLPTQSPLMLAPAPSILTARGFTAQETNLLINTSPKARGIISYTYIYMPLASCHRASGRSCASSGVCQAAQPPFMREELAVKPACWAPRAGREGERSAEPCFACMYACMQMTHGMQPTSTL